MRFELIPLDSRPSYMVNRYLCPLVRLEGLEPPLPFGKKFLRLLWLPLHHNRIYVKFGSTCEIRTHPVQILSLPSPAAGLRYQKSQQKL